MSSAVNAISDVFTGFVDVTVGVVSGEYLFKAVGAIVEFAGADIVDDVLGMDKLGKEISNVGSDTYQIGKVLGGEYHDDMKALKEKQEQVDRRISSYNYRVDELSEKIQGLIAFHEIFQMSAQNRLDAYVGKYGPEIDAAIEDLKLAAASLESEYDFVIGLTQGAFIQRLIGSIIMTIGGLMSDLGDIASGNADATTWKRAVTATVTIVILVFAISTGQLYIVTAILATLSVFMMLDGMYAGGAATGAIMSLLDFVFNDMLNLDDLIGKDFDKFDKDSEDYQQMVTYTQLTISLAAMGSQWYTTPSQGMTLNQARGSMTQQTLSGTSSGGVFKSAVQGSSTTMSYGSAASTANMTTTFLGIDTSTYSSIYRAFSTANEVGDMLNADKAYNALADKLKEDRKKVDAALDSKYRKNFMKHYKDTAYFLQDQQEFIDRYLWGMTAQSMYVDPYGTTPVANIRFTPDKDARMMVFGFEDVFNESKQAGSKGYFNSILYG